VAILIELARAAAMRRHAQSLRFVAFTNEESPFTRTNKMGSYVYAHCAITPIIGATTPPTSSISSGSPG
jgi:hypothetical protein